MKELAERLAEAVGATVIIGVRPRGKGWFVRCDDTEFDVAGDTDDDISMALRALRDHFAARFRLQAAEMAGLQSALAALDAI